jgi:DNA repair photolyase
MEPRAAAPQRRLEAVRRLADAGIPVGVMTAPIIPQLNDRDLESILEAAAAHGATSAGWVMLRLPLEVAPLFRDWLEAHYPMRAAHVMSLVQQMRGGHDYQSQFGTRMRGVGEFAALIEKRFTLACKRFGLNLQDDSTREDRSHVRGHGVLDTTRFRPPRAHDAQLDLFV